MWVQQSGRLYSQLHFSGTVRLMLEVTHLRGIGLQYSHNEWYYRSGPFNDTTLSIRRDVPVDDLTTNATELVEQIEREVMRAFHVEIYEPEG